MSGERFTLDTNILFYYVDAGARLHHERAMQIIDHAVFADCWLTLQSISEFYAAVTRKGVITPARAAALANDWLEAFPTVAPTVSAMQAALASSVAGHASYWDALLIATAAEAGCTAILTEDLADAGTLHGVRILNPFKGDEVPLAVRTLLETS